MTTYWVLFSLPFLGAMMPLRLDAYARAFMWLGFALFVALIVGLRHEVGGDWEPYLDIYDDMRSRSFFEAVAEGGFRSADPGYALLNWLSYQMGWGIYGVNLGCGLLFVVGFSMFARRQPNPWLAWVVAIPYLIVVVVMGYSRQGVALGFVFAALAALEARKVAGFMALIAVAALFHKSAAIMLPFAFLIRQDRKSLLRNVAFAGALLAAALAFLYSHLEGYWAGYLEYRQESQGAGVRVLMNAIPAFVLLFYRPFRRRWPDVGHWRYLAWASVGALLIVGVASTAVDRIALYLAPLQIYAWCRFPALFRQPGDRAAAMLGVCALYAAVMAIWLNLSGYAYWWVPYKSILFENRFFG